MDPGFCVLAWILPPMSSSAPWQLVGFCCHYLLFILEMFPTSFEDTRHCLHLVSSFSTVVVVVVVVVPMLGILDTDLVAMAQGRLSTFNALRDGRLSIRGSHVTRCVKRGFDFRRNVPGCRQ